MSGRTRKSLFQLLMHHFRSQRSSWRSVLFIIVIANVFPHDIPEHIWHVLFRGVTGNEADHDLWSTWLRCLCSDRGHGHGAERNWINDLATSGSFEPLPQHESDNQPNVNEGNAGEWGQLRRRQA